MSNVKGWLVDLIAGILPDPAYLFIKAWIRTGVRPHLLHPVTLNDKVRWLMLNYRDPHQTLVVDKVRVRDLVAERIGPQYLKEVIGVYESTEDIDFDCLPQRFALKVNHGSGWNVLCKNKDSFDVPKALQQLDGWMNRNYYHRSKEWAYRNVEPKILCEQYYVDDADRPLDEYTIFCVFGKPYRITVVRRGNEGKEYALYDPRWRPIDSGWGDRYKRFVCPRPDDLGEMLEIASKLSADLPYCRIDLMKWQGRILFGEITLYPGGANNKNMPAEVARKFGAMIDLERIKRDYMTN